MMQLIFFGASFLVLLLGHALVYLFLVKIFGVSLLSSKLIIALSLVLVFLSAIISSYLIHKSDNLFTRSYYIASTFLIGVLVNIAVMAVMVILLKITASGFGFVIPALAVRIFFVSGTILISALGLYRAMVPAVTEYQVYISELPDSWDNKTVVHISDVHLGPVYREAFLRRTISAINDLQPEAVFITGDFFDGMEANFSWLNHPLNQLKAPRGIYYGFGNHDLYLGFEKAAKLMEGNQITVMDNKLKVVDGLQIIGINYSFNSDFDLEKEILGQVGYNPSVPSLLMFHAPKNIKLSKAAGIDLQLSGHTHDGQMFPFNVLAKWAHQGYGYGFFQEDNFNLIVSCGVGTWGPPMRTASRSEIVKITLHKKL